MITARWRALRHDAFRRSGGRCQCTGDCGGHAGPCTARLHPGPGGYEADHILPKSRGGPDAPANLRATCPECNRRKGARVTTLPDGPLRRALVSTYAVAARLARIGIVAMPARPVIAPGTITLTLVPAPGHAHVGARAVAEIRAAVNDQAARVYTSGATLRVELPRRPRMAVPLATMPRRGLAFGVGVDAANRVAFIDLAESPGVLVAGQSGSGKSETLRAVVWHLALAGASLVLVDTDGDTWSPFSRCTRLACAVAQDVTSGADAVAYARQLMDARPLGADGPPLVLAVDEVHMLDAGTRDVLMDVAKRGRKRGTYVIVASHRPTAEALPKALTDQLTWAIAGKVGDYHGSKVIIGQPGAEALAGRGDMLLAHGGHVVRFQAAMGGAGDWAALVKAETEPSPAPRIPPPADARYIRKPDDAAITWAVERYHATGEAPSATAIHRRFGGAMDAARRRRDAALEELATA